MIQWYKALTGFREFFQILKYLTCHFTVLQVSFISGVGGGLSDVVPRAFKRIMTLKLASSFCYKGQSTIKQGKQHLILKSVLIGNSLLFCLTLKLLNSQFLYLIQMASNQFLCSTKRWRTLEVKDMIEATGKQQTAETAGRKKRNLYFYSRLIFDN